MTTIDHDCSRYHGVHGEFAFTKGDPEPGKDWRDNPEDAGLIDASNGSGVPTWKTTAGRIQRNYVWLDGDGPSYRLGKAKPAPAAVPDGDHGGSPVDVAIPDDWASKPFLTQRSIAVAILGGKEHVPAEFKGPDVAKVIADELARRAA